MARCETDETEREKCEEAGEGEAVQVKAFTPQPQICQKIDDGHALL
jgi:hypothetical protein